MRIIPVLENEKFQKFQMKLIEERIKKHEEFSR